MDLEGATVDGFLPKPNRRAHQELDEGVEDLEEETGEDDTAVVVVDVAVVAVVDVDRIVGVVLVGYVALVAKALCVVSTRSPSSSLQKEGERVFLGLFSD